MLLRGLLIISLLLIIFLRFTTYSSIKFHSTKQDFNKNLSAVLKNFDLQSGDLIFRRGTSIESQIVLLTDSDSEFSHVGMIYKINDKSFVIHTVPAEGNYDPAFIKFDSLNEFVSGERAVRFAVYRLRQNHSEKLSIASNYAYNCYNNKFRFDSNYDLNSEKQLYCTELIWKAFMQAGIDLVENRLKEINLIVINKKMIMPSSIIQSNLIKKIYSN